METPDQCEAHLAHDHPVMRAARALEIDITPPRCKRRAAHWTHDVAPIGRVRLCTQHFKMIERRRALGTVDHILMFWREAA